MVRLPELPPTREPRLAPEKLRPNPSVAVVVATLPNVFAPVKYGMLPMTAAEDVDRPLNEKAPVE